MMEPEWMHVARSLLGQREIPGSLTAPFITTMLKGLGAWWRDDETAWCATFVSWCLKESGVDYPKAFYRARAFESWGRPWAGSWPPPYGAIAVLSRPPKAANGHVCFYVGQTSKVYPGTATRGLLLLGGNQDNQVCVGEYPFHRVVAWRWPRGLPVVNYIPPAADRAHLQQHTQLVRRDA